MLTALIVGSVALVTSVEISVDGEGFLRGVQHGRAVYAKSAELVVINGKLSDKSGVAFLPTISVLREGELNVDLEGNVFCSGRHCGQLVLAAFDSNESGPGFFAASGKARLGNPGEGTFGIIRMSGGKKPAAKERLQNIALTGNNSQGVQQSKGTVITVNPRSEVSGKTFLLSEIAVISGPANAIEELGAIRIGDSPAIGVERGLDRTQIIAKLKAAGVNTVQTVIVVPANARVTRACQKIPHAKFVEVAIAEASRQLGEQVKLRAEREVIEMALPNGELKLVCENFSGNAQRASVLVSAYVDGQRINARSIVLVPNGETPQLKSGAIVNIRIASNGVVVTTRGKLQRSAFAGATVEVKTDQGVMLSGTLLADGSVEVKL